MISTGASTKTATAEVDASIDRLVHYAGWTDKLAAVLGSSNPVSSPVLLLFHARSDRRGGHPCTDRNRRCSGLISVIAPVITGGNACVAIAAEQDPCVAITFAEVIATSDVPAGVINILTGQITELAPHLAAPCRRQRSRSHRRRCGAAHIALEQAASETVKRVYVPKGAPDFTAPRPASPDCAPSSRSRPCGIRRAPYPSPAARLTSQVVSAVKATGQGTSDG